VGAVLPQVVHVNIAAGAQESGRYSRVVPMTAGAWFEDWLDCLDLGRRWAIGEAYARQLARAGRRTSRGIRRLVD